MTSVLISGGGVAGPALALRLRAHGFDVTVVERAPAPRPGGQALDVRGAALDVADRMGLLGELRELRTRMRGMSVLDAEGTELMRSEEYAASSGRLGGPDIEVLREDLAGLLHRHGVAAGVRHVFGDTVTALRETDAGVRVEFAHAAPRTVDLVVGADGLRSATRRLVFGPDERFLHHLGVYVAVYTMENILKLEDWQVWVQAPGVGGGIYPARDNTEIRVNLGFESGPIEGFHRDRAAQRAELAARFAGLGWEFPRLIEGARTAPDFYCDAMAQVRMDTWSRGRVTLLGDAAFCPSPLSGQGTSLALVGAWVLGEELGRSGVAEAPAAYEARMRPFVALNQALVANEPGSPESEAAIETAKVAIAL
ncbi:FAD-dependent monooxygenase [Catenuloplanes atrovinosus]|uniref:2-polyprenyl-6-methoxyphenol hydroxylase-like FAD-dependent oxidoreductase n=1 Tax=Catenuloplanes atrovinosus TaxID=137266 RepID=A0AAE3YXT9_9ACTN|nr:FAD-dependent monooxygenase [Catenuloplanes atrovinosus]MDR7280591.1 2-polyprenyl-6-methoxyphenol hydroxylase-like FAD-dependent oxidoreductase [Catenuloplanes atrovinosus]